MQLTYLLVALQVGFAVAFPTPDLSKDDSHPGNKTVEDTSGVMPCDRKTLQVYCPLSTLDKSLRNVTIMINGW